MITQKQFETIKEYLVIGCRFSDLKIDEFQKIITALKSCVSKKYRMKTIKELQDEGFVFTKDGFVSKEQDGLSCQVHEIVWSEIKNLTWDECTSIAPEFYVEITE